LFLFVFFELAAEGIFRCCFMRTARDRQSYVYADDATTKAEQRDRDAKQERKRDEESRERKSSLFNQLLP